MQTIEFDGLPSMLLPYVQVILSRKPMRAAAGTSTTALLFRSRNVRIKPAHLARYIEVCGSGQTQAVPPAFLHVLAMPLHMRLFVHPAFPLKVLGLVQLRNVIRHHAPVLPQQTLTLSVQYDSLRETELGQEVDLVTRAHVGEQLVWEEISTMLARNPVANRRAAIERATRSPEHMVRETTLQVAAETGRRYVPVSGDWNPIHLFDRTARWFHFKHAVAHGMWSLARCLGQAQLPDSPFEATAEFKLPVYLPSEVIFCQQREAEGDLLTLTSPKSDRLHLAVHLKKL